MLYAHNALGEAGDLGHSLGHVKRTAATDPLRRDSVPTPSIALRLPFKLGQMVTWTPISPPIHEHSGPERPRWQILLAIHKVRRQLDGRRGLRLNSYAAYVSSRSSNAAFYHLSRRFWSRKLKPGNHLWRTVPTANLQHDGLLSRTRSHWSVG